MPASIWRRTSRRSVSSSSEKSFRNGVTIAVPHPVNPRNMAAYLFLIFDSGGACLRVVRKNHVSKFVQPALADHPLRRFQRAARETFAAARRVPQRDGVRRRVKSDFVCAGIARRRGSS